MFKRFRNLFNSNTYDFDESSSNENGFTLIELLAVMAVIASLSGIAISQYSAYKKDAHNITALSDFRNSMTGIEAYFDDNQVYPSCTGSDCEDMIPGLALSKGVLLNYTAVGVDGASGFACHEKGDTRYNFSSIAEGLILPVPGDCNP